MGFTDSLKKVIGIEELEEDDYVTEEELLEAKEKLAKESKQSYSTQSSIHTDPISQTKKTPLTKSKEKRFSVTNTSALKLILIEPKDADECPKLVDSLKARKPVIINIEKLETDTARKIFDFLKGATYALNGNVQKIANNIFIFTPENVVVSSDGDEAVTTVEPDSRNLWR